MGNSFAFIGNNHLFQRWQAGTYDILLVNRSSGTWREGRDNAAFEQKHPRNEKGLFIHKLNILVRFLQKQGLIEDDIGILVSSAPIKINGHD